MISQRAKNVGLKELEIFDNFRVDINLPKHKENVDENSINVVNIDNGGRVYIAPTNATEGWLENTINNHKYGDDILKYKINLKFKKILLLIKLFFKKKKYFNNIYDFFINFSENAKEIKISEEIGKYYEDALKQAKKLNQDVLVERLLSLIDVYKYETLLYDKKIRKYVTEEQIYDFYEKQSGENKALKLSWIQNFTRVIPSDIVELKEKIDKYKIFDNYVILHYDVSGDGSDLTEKEKEIRKDPILFGVIKKSRKLYYIADWKDEVCDLTLDKMFKTLGENVLTINNKSIKTYIDSGENKKRSFKRK